jgi:hypothetical protein
MVDAREEVKRKSTEMKADKDKCKAMLQPLFTGSTVLPCLSQ